MLSTEREGVRSGETIYAIKVNSALERETNLLHNVIVWGCVIHVIEAMDILEFQIVCLPPTLWLISVKSYRLNVVILKRFPSSRA